MRLFLFHCLAVSLASAAAAVAAAAPADEDAAIAQRLAEMLRDARTVVSNNQDLINNPTLGDKHLTGRVVLDQTVDGYRKATGSDPVASDPSSRQGRLLRAMMAAIGAVTDDNQPTINEKGTAFKGFIPAVFARLVSEDFNQRAKGEAVASSFVFMMSASQASGRALRLRTSSGGAVTFTAASPFAR